MDNKATPSNPPRPGSPKPSPPPKGSGPRLERSTDLKLAPSPPVHCSDLSSCRITTVTSLVICLANVVMIGIFFKPEVQFVSLAPGFFAQVFRNTVISTDCAYRKSPINRNSWGTNHNKMQCNALWNPGILAVLHRYLFKNKQTMHFSHTCRAGRGYKTTPNRVIKPHQPGPSPCPKPYPQSHPTRRPASHLKFCHKCMPTALSATPSQAPWGLGYSL